MSLRHLRISLRTEGVWDGQRGRCRVRILAVDTLVADGNDVEMFNVCRRSLAAYARCRG